MCRKWYLEDYVKLMVLTFFSLTIFFGLFLTIESILQLNFFAKHHPTIGDNYELYGFVGVSVGIILCVLGVIGILAAFFVNFGCLSTLCVSLLVLSFVFLVIGCVMITTLQFMKLDKSVENVMSKSFKKEAYANQSDLSNDDFKELMEDLKCCGVRSWADNFVRINRSYSTYAFPIACCKNKDCSNLESMDRIHGNGCLPVAVTKIYRMYYIVTLFILCLAPFLFFGAWLVYLFAGVFNYEEDAESIYE